MVTEITYEELLRQVCRVANAMKDMGVKKGDFVTLYMPMVPEAAVTMLACARLGAPHSVVFAGFSAEALRDRIVVSARSATRQQQRGDITVTLGTAHSRTIGRDDKRGSHETG